MRYAQALTEALREEMRRDGSVVVFGEDVGKYGGVFQVTKGLADEFGANRVFDTPISENGIVGAAAGMAMHGLRPVVELMYIDFLPLALDSLVNCVAMFPVVYGGQVKMPLVVRTQGGAGGFAGPQHSKSLEAWAAHIPGLHTVMPATPADAKGLLKAAIRSDEPVLFIEHKLLYNKRGEVPEGEYLVPLGTANVVRAGTHVSVFATSRMVWESLTAADALARRGIDVEVVDVRSLRPLDSPTLVASARKTGRALVVSESWRAYGPTAEIAAVLSEGAFDMLKGPVKRLGGMSVPIPASPALEPLVIPNAAGIEAAIAAMMEVRAGSPGA